MDLDEFVRADSRNLPSLDAATMIEYFQNSDKFNAAEIKGVKALIHPERDSEIEASLSSLRKEWETLQQLAASRTALLDEAIADHKFDDSLKELELWVSESVKRMSGSAAPESVAEAESMLELHQERKAEIDNRQKNIAALQREAEHSPEKLQKLAALAKTLDQAWLERKQYLTQAHQLQLLKEQARQTEDWLAAKEAFLNNDDLGENLDAVETLIRKHLEFSKLLESGIARVDELEKFAKTILQDGHYDKLYIERRLALILARRDKLKESCRHRGVMLEQSKQLHEFLRNLNHESEWIALKMQTANDQNYRELSNLQSKIQKHSAFESELAANKKRIDDVANHGEELIEAKHYASQEISTHVEELENQWRELQSAVKLRRERLQEAYQARVYFRGLDDFTAWLDDVESQLLSEDHGKDLASVTALLKRHTRLEQQVASKADTVTQLADNARQLVETGHLMADDILSRAGEAETRYRQLQEPMQIRRDNLEDAALLHRWDRDADEEMRWMVEREPLAALKDTGATLQETQALLKKHLALEAELMAREPTVKAVCARASQLARRGHFAGAALETRAREVAAALAALGDAAAGRGARLRARRDLLQLTADITEVSQLLSSRRAVLVGTFCGRDEDSALALMTRLEAQQRELAALRPRIDALQARVQERGPEDAEEVTKQIEELVALYEEMKLLSAKRQQRIEQSLKYFKFVQECEETQEWISEQMGAAASEDYGLDVEHVDTLQQAFDNFLAQLNANEGRIEAVCDAGNALLEENTPEAERVRQRIDDIRGLWDDLKELALARQEALAGARQVHEFDRRADETVAWIAEKEPTLGTDGGRSTTELHAQRRRLHALTDDLAAISAAHASLQEEAARLGTAFPDAREHVTSKLEDVTEALEALSSRAARRQQQLELAGQLQAYFHTYQDLLAWTNETIAVVTAPELAHDVPGAERLVARHREIGLEVEAKDEAFKAHYSDGEKLVREKHFMSSEIEERMATLRARRAQLDAAWAARADIYAQHLDALTFRKEADALEGWITSRVPLVRDGKVGESVAQVEELLNRHGELEQAIDAQKDRFNALNRITLVEQAFKKQKESEEAARARTAAQQAAERAQRHRQQEVDRIAELRRKDADTQLSSAPEQTSLQPASSEETVSPAPQFDRLPRTEPVKRAESMSVMKTPKRTPSFTTRRRTQSFRRHRRDADLPPVEIEGYLERKQESGVGGKRAPVRSWRSYYCVLCGQLLCFFRDELDFGASKAAAPPQAILHARCEPAGDYTKRANVFRLACSDGAEYLFSCPTPALMAEWVAKLSFHAALPPALQLTPYEPPSLAELHRRLPSASSSSASSPEPERRRTQAEILQEHRESQGNKDKKSAEKTTPERNIESNVLPSLPPRKPPSPEEASDVVLRNSEQSSAAWGRTRFSNGRDLNTEFIKSQRDVADGAPPLPLSGPPDRPNIPDREPKAPERANQVSALVNSYQQRARDQNRNMPSAWQNYERQNNNWGVETSHFYTASELAYGGNQRPASVAGSGGSPALDQRPASRSSGESELSVSGVSKDKKDKKGVFGGLFSKKKKRPQSHM